MNRAAIFIVDDDDGHAYLIEKNLRAAGVPCEIRRFSSGGDLLGSLSDPDESLPSLITLDLNMPGLHGLRVLETLRQTAATRLLPVVVLTTAEDPGEVLRCYELGCNLYLTKPIQPNEFAAAIKSLGTMLHAFRPPGTAPPPAPTASARSV